MKLKNELLFYAWEEKRDKFGEELTYLGNDLIHIYHQKNGNGLLKKRNFQIKSPKTKTPHSAMYNMQESHLNRVIQTGQK